MSEKDNSGAPKLDLGLSDLLGGQARQSKLREERSPQNPEETRIFTLGDRVDDPRHDFIALANSRQWGLLVHKAEAAIADGDDIEARLWWLRGHLGAFSLPVSLLAAPFETICRQIGTTEIQSRDLSLVREIGAMLLDRLRDVGDKGQEHAVHNALHNLGIAEGSKESFGSRSEIPSLTPNFQGQTVGDPSAGENGLAVVQRRSEIVEKGLSKRIPQTLLLGILICAAVYAGWRWMYQETDVGSASESFVAGQPMLELRSPTVQAREAVGNLGALFYSINEGPKPQQGEGSRGAPAQSSSPSDPTPVARALETKRAPVMAPLDQKPAASVTPPTSGTVDTSGPVEGPDFGKGVESRSTDRARLPDPIDQARPENGSGDASYPDGALRLPEVLKTIIVRTDVMASPSYQAPVIGSLERGDRVSVEGRVGQWIRIRSRKGRAGFVFAQDVGDIEDFRAGR